MKNEINYNPTFIRESIEKIEDEWGKVISKTQLIENSYQGKCSDELRSKILDNTKIVKSIIEKLNIVNTKIDNATKEMGVVYEENSNPL